MVIITPGVAGPFDLGAVVARAALYIDESSAEVTVESDPIPTILQGIPLDVRTISVIADRAGFTLNPTSCEVKAISGEATTSAGAIAPLQNRFQVGGCRGLDFAPKLALSLTGATRRTGHPAFKAVLTQPPGQANIAKPRSPCRRLVRRPAPRRQSLHPASICRRYLPLELGPRQGPGLHPTAR